jgi:hypothetical protein
MTKRSGLAHAGLAGRVPCAAGAYMAAVFCDAGLKNVSEKEVSGRGAI